MKKTSKKHGRFSEFQITHPDKILFLQDGFSKQDVVDYYARIAKYILPYLQDRPLSLLVFPQGIDKKGYFNKNAPEHYPEFLQRITVPKKQDHSEMQMLAVSQQRDLCFLAGQNVIELHISLSKISNLEQPDQIILDFDPSDNDFEKVRTAALALKDQLDSRHLQSFVKTTGSAGVHVHIPVKPDWPFARIKELSHKMAASLQARCPDITTLAQRKNQRGNKVFIDYLRNDYAMTAVAPYSLRARHSAPVATPIDWDELKNPDIGPRSFHLKNIFRRLAQKKDPWQDFNTANAVVDWDNIE